MELVLQKIISIHHNLADLRIHLIMSLSPLHCYHNSYQPFQNLVMKQMMGDMNTFQVWLEQFEMIASVWEVVKRGITE